MGRKEASRNDDGVDSVASRGRERCRDGNGRERRTCGSLSEAGEEVDIEVGERRVQFSIAHARFVSRPVLLLLLSFVSHFTILEQLPLPTLIRLLLLLLS